ncbi:D-ribose pyranase [Staphylococcus intermedius]|uniref:D-ribose pyranase n=1 Tax=Staphylococcus intermedius NCTC 11048 TaxID=1141106 RepID=A0A380G3R8_STAIN|nr:D-ribose pyranase [Staphylococcus intermedius]PCF64036.1 D-ribose pyranase [Staphylococcus intermedius]PCF78751.1 D-ribose pyranase [Staphylococcus intermedius]PCF79724.1 D-ribose pyranase [Staphylococcus intermedius]PCF85926.1 D-ribose pyranase [Staphylococcus intermedius]PCF89617.1 D-ribose pyranase [Staphylococcus intermedius]
MYRYGTLNSEISKVLSTLGHTDEIVIADCGLPIPDGVKRIDLALKQGTPSFKEVYEELMHHMVVEQVVVAQEMTEQNGTLYQMINKDFPTLEMVSHEDFKKQTRHAKAIIRTGEATPYANIILKSGVIF